VPPGRGLRKLGCHVGVALRLAELGVPEDLLHNPDVDSLFQQEGR
jgi:hypothetical protein